MPFQPLWLRAVTHANSVVRADEVETIQFMPVEKLQAPPVP